MQNEINKTYTPQQLAEFDTLLTGLEALTADLAVFTQEEKAALVKTPDNATDWMNGMLLRARQNMGILSRAFDPEPVAQDLRLDQDVTPRLMRLQRVVDRMQTTQFLARSDAFSALLGVRRSLKDAHVAGVDDDLSDGLKRFFSRTSRATPAPAPAVAN